MGRLTGRFAGQGCCGTSTEAALTRLQHSYESTRHKDGASCEVQPEQSGSGCVRAGRSETNSNNYLVLKKRLLNDEVHALNGWRGTPYASMP